MKINKHVAAFFSKPRSLLLYNIPSPVSSSLFSGSYEYEKRVPTSILSKTAGLCLANRADVQAGASIAALFFRMTDGKWFEK
jgi:hypothetical protein